MTELASLIERVERCDGHSLPLPDAIELWCMSAGCKLVEHRSGERGLDGYWTYLLLVDDSGGRKLITVPEWQLPDHSVDAALALVERCLGPQFDYAELMFEGTNGDPRGCKFTLTIAWPGEPVNPGHDYIGIKATGNYLTAAPLAIILATLRALKAKQATP